MSVINCKVSYIRPNYNTIQEWMNHPNHEYIGRRGIVFINKERFPKQDSIWANPFKIGRDGTRDDVLCKYEKLLRDKVYTNDVNKADAATTYKEDLLKLDGKILGCWCKPEPCHGDVLLKLIEELKQEQNQKQKQE